MSVIIKKFKNINNMDKKSAYTWGACIIVFFLVASTLLSLVSGGDDTKDNFNMLKAKGYDLAAMPFASDLAEQELLNGPYSDIAANPVQSTLFSAAEKEERQEEDAAGLSDTEPPDEEYAQAETEKQFEEERRAAYSSGYERQRTEINAFSGGGSMAQGPSGFSGGTSAWSASGGNDGGGSRKGGYSTGADARLAEKLRVGRAGSGLLNVAQATKDAKKGDLDTALSGFTGGDKKSADLSREKNDAAPPAVEEPKMGEPPSAKEADEAADKADENPDKKDPSCECSGRNSGKGMCLVTGLIAPMAIGIAGAYMGPAGAAIAPKVSEVVSSYGKPGADGKC